VVLILNKVSDRNCLMCGAYTVIIDSIVEHARGENEVVVCLNRGTPIRDKNGTIIGRTPKENECGYALSYGDYCMFDGR
jgi:hypothetical protein